jgi:hypothetical protein
MTRRIVLVGATAGFHCQAYRECSSTSAQLAFPLSRREILKSTTAFIAAAGAVSTAAAQPFGAATTIVNIHSGQPDQKKVIEFYASSVLPKLGTRS